MRKFLANLKDKLTGPDYGDVETTEEYVELDTDAQDARSKVLVRPFQLEDFEDIKEILDILREGRTIVLINIRTLKEKDIVELKRAINKLKKTTDAIDGELAGFGEDYLIATPAFATIYRSSSAAQHVEEESL